MDKSKQVLKHNTKNYPLESIKYINRLHIISIKEFNSSIIHYYDVFNLIKWLKINNIDPYTNQPFSVYNLKSIIKQVTHIENETSNMHNELVAKFKSLELDREIILSLLEDSQQKLRKLKNKFNWQQVVIGKNVWSENYQKFGINCGVQDLHKDRKIELTNFFKNQFNQLEQIITKQINQYDLLKIKLDEDIAIYTYEDSEMKSTFEEFEILNDFVEKNEYIMKLSDFEKDSPQKLN